MIAILFALSLFLGGTSWDLVVSSQIFELRFLRSMAALLCGGTLAVCGVLFQTLLRNPLAEPYTLGISSGASFFSVLFLGLSPYPSTLAALAGGLLTVLLIYVLAKREGNFPHRIILGGVMMNFLFSSLTLLWLLLSGETRIQTALFWMMGNLSLVNASQLIGLLLASLVGIALLYRCSLDLNLMSLGESVALSLGVRTQKQQLLWYLILTLLVASSIAVVGPIGFVGLLVPHWVRHFWGNYHERLIPAAFIVGAGFLLLSDVLSRTVFYPREVPIGIVTSLLGAPYFLFLLKKNI